MTRTFREEHMPPARAGGHETDDASRRTARDHATSTVADAADGGAVSRRALALTVAALLLVAAIVGIDIADDWGAGASALHVAVEGAALVLAFATAVAVARALARSIAAGRRRAALLQRDLLAARGDAERWRTEARSAVRGIAAAIDTQLERWSLTAAEREVAMLLLKGLSLKEIAEVRGTSERTTRQQALAIYKKAGLTGRAELSAFFLEELL